MKLVFKNVKYYGFWKKLWLRFFCTPINYQVPDENIVINYYHKNGVYYVSNIQPIIKVESITTNKQESK